MKPKFQSDQDAIDEIRQIVADMCPLDLRDNSAVTGWFQEVADIVQEEMLAPGVRDLWYEAARMMYPNHEA